MFSGVSGIVVGPIMARMNREAEHEAVERLQSTRLNSALVIGFGPGVGLAALHRAHPNCHIIGADPSAEMVKQATRRNAAAIKSGKMVLHTNTLEEIAPLNLQVDAAIAVNSLQICAPIKETCQILATLLREGGALVAITHDWAVKKDFGSTNDWLEQWADGLNVAGFANVETGLARSEQERALLIAATR